MSEAPSTEASSPTGQLPSWNRRDATEPATAAALFRERREDILARWEATLRRSPPAAQLSQKTLRDHFPGVLDRLITLLEQGPGGQAEDRSHDVQIHSLDRLRRRVPVASVVRDYRVLRETLTSVWRDETGNSPLFAEAWIRVHQILDDFIVQAVER